MVIPATPLPHRRQEDRLQHDVEAGDLRRVAQVVAARAHPRGPSLVREARPPLHLRQARHRPRWGGLLLRGGLRAPIVF